MGDMPIHYKQYFVKDFTHILGLQYRSCELDSSLI